MSTEKKELSPLDAMLAQYEANNKPKFEKNKSAKEYDLKNYFTTFIPKGIDEATKEIRILPSENGTPFDQIHVHVIQIDGDWKKLPCLKHEENKPCPFCETYDALRATGLDSDKELAKKFNPRLMYIAKVIDRSAEDEGVKFWRFSHAYDKGGIFDKIVGLSKSLKKNQNVSDPDNGRDLAITINRNMHGTPVVSQITAMDSTPISEDETQQAEWLSDARTWRDVYAIKSYDFLEIVVNGGIPIWDKEAKCFVDKNAKVNESENSTNTDNSEISMGLETIKAGIEVAKTTKTVKPKTSDENNEVDDLPF